SLEPKKTVDTFQSRNARLVEVNDRSPSKKTMNTSIARRQPAPTPLSKPAKVAGGGGASARATASKVPAPAPSSNPVLRGTPGLPRRRIGPPTLPPGIRTARSSSAPSTPARHADRPGEGPAGSIDPPGTDPTDIHPQRGRLQGSTIEEGTTMRSTK